MSKKIIVFIVCILFAASFQVLMAEELTADLVINSVDYSYNDDGTEVDFDVNYQNIGSSTNELDFYISYDCGENFTGGTYVSNAVHVYEEYTKNIHVYISSNVELNTTCTFYIDRYIPFGSLGDNMVSELDEGNNEYTKKIEYDGADPDLIPTGLKVREGINGSDYSIGSKEHNIGDSLNITGNYQNIGGKLIVADSANPFKSNLKITKNGDVFLDKTQYSNSGATAGFWDWTPSEAGEYVVTMTLDIEDDIDESDENNNTITKNLIIKDSLLPDLVFIENTFRQYITDGTQYGWPTPGIPLVVIDIEDKNKKNNFEGLPLKVLANGKEEVFAPKVNDYAFSYTINLNYFNFEKNKAYNTFFTLDPDNTISESNENNNILVKTIEISENSLNISDVSVEADPTQLSELEDGEAYIFWHTNNNDATCSVAYGENITNTTKVGEYVMVANGKYRYQVKLGNLEDNTKYYYKILCSLASGTSSETIVDSFDVGTVTSDDDTDEGEGEDDIISGIVLRLQRKISQLEQQVIELEKKLTELDSQFAEKYAGTMFLDVENHGRLWYVDPASKNRYYFENGEGALSIGSKLATGISYENIQQIPIGVPDKLYNLKDTDGDGLSDRLESALGTDASKTDTDGDGISDKDEINNGYNPINDEKYSYSQDLIDRFEGKMLLQVSGPNSHGEIWYIHNGKRWYGGTEDSMYEIMKARSLGATADNIRKIAVGEVATE